MGSTCRKALDREHWIKKAESGHVGTTREETPEVLPYVCLEGPMLLGGGSGLKSHDSQRRDRILRYFSAQNTRNFLHLLGRFPYQNCTENLEKKDKNPLERTQTSSGETSAILQISVPCRGRTCPERG